VDTWQAIDTTRAIRKFTAEPLKPEHLHRILDAGRRSGSSKNQQNWDFIVCTDRAHLAQLAEVGPFAAHLAGAAAAIALVVPDPATADAPLLPGGFAAVLQCGGVAIICFPALKCPVELASQPLAAG